MSTISGHGLVQVSEDQLFELICQVESSPEFLSLTNEIVNIEQMIRDHVDDDAWKLYLRLESIESQYRLLVVESVVKRIGYCIAHHAV